MKFITLLLFFKLAVSHDWLADISPLNPGTGSVYISSKHGECLTIIMESTSNFKLFYISLSKFLFKNTVVSNNIHLIEQNGTEIIAFPVEGTYGFTIYKNEIAIVEGSIRKINCLNPVLTFENVKVRLQQKDASPDTADSKISLNTWLLQLGLTLILYFNTNW